MLQEYFLYYPNTLTFFLMLTTYIVIQIQIRLKKSFWKNNTENNI